MALTAEGDALTDELRRRQATLSAYFIGQLAQLWPILDPQRIDATRDAWLRAVVALIAQGYNLSAAITAAYLPAFQAAEGLAPSALPELRPPDLQAVAAAQALLGPIKIKQNLAAGYDLAVAMRIARDGTAAAAQSAAANGGRALVLDAVASDSRAVGWARVASAGACAFCALLCSRGPVYREERTASFRPHPGCNCVAEPLYSRSPDAWSPAARQYEADYLAAFAAARTDEQPDRHKQDPLNVYRRHLAARRGGT